MVKIPASGWRGSPLVATLHVIKLLIVWSRQRDQVANAVIEARPHSWIYLSFATAFSYEWYRSL